MTLKDRWRRFADRVDEFESKWLKGIIFTYSYGGAFRYLVYSACTLYFLWHIYDLLAWWDGLQGVQSHIDHGRQRWARIWAVIIGGSGIAVSLFAMATITRLRWRERKDAKGLWFAKSSNAEGELALQAALREKATKEAATSQSQQVAEQADETRQAELPMPDTTLRNDAPQQPIGIAPAPESRPAQRFGETRLEVQGGKATLIVPRKTKREKHET